MSLLINMEMPTSEEKCKFFQPAPFRSPYCVINGVCNGIEDCSIVPVPPHGRLGDLDELYNHLNEWYLTHEHGFSENEKIYIRAMLSGVKDSPTIIPASKEGET